jgi:plastin-1
MDAARKLNVQMLGIGAQDIATGHKQFILTIVWQLVRLHALQLIGSKTEQDLLDWVSQTEHVTSFSDPKFANGRLLIRLCEKVDPSVVDWSLVKPGDSESDKELNAKYAIALARKLGAVIFLVWDDIPDLNKKMILIFVCSLYDLKHAV